MEGLSHAKIQDALQGIAWVRRLVYLPVTTSTNDVARALAQDKAPEATLVVADEQTAGRGRMGRAWWAPPNTCLLMSVLLRPPLSPTQALRLTMIAGLATAEAIERATGLAAQLKWPNDIWLRHKKAGGILTETALTGEQLEYAIVGIGLNVNATFREQPALAETATSLKLETGQEIDRLTVLRELVERLAGWYAQITRPQVKNAWAARLMTLGQPVSIQQPIGRLEGTAEGVDDDGALLVRTADGALRRLLAGDVSLQVVSSPVAQ